MQTQALGPMTGPGVMPDAVGSSLVDLPKGEGPGLMDTLTDVYKKLQPAMKQRQSMPAQQLVPVSMTGQDFQALQQVPDFLKGGNF